MSPIVSFQLTLARIYSLYALPTHICTYGSSTYHFSLAVFIPLFQVTLKLKLIHMTPYTAAELLGILEVLSYILRHPPRALSKPQSHSVNSHLFLDMYINFAEKFRSAFDETPCIYLCLSVYNVMFLAVNKRNS